MANDCEAFLGGLGVFTDLYAQLVRELSKYQRLVEQRYVSFELHIKKGIVTNQLKTGDPTRCRETG